MTDEMNKIGKSDFSRGAATTQKLRYRQVMIQQGRVVRSIPGTFWVIARFDGIQEASCIYAPALMAPLMGVKDCSMPPEGTPILAVTMPAMPTRKIIICCLPEERINLSDPEAAAFIHMFGSGAEQGVDYYSEDSYHKIATDPDRQDALCAHSGRPLTGLPGEWVKSNGFGVLMAVYHMMTTMKATERAKLEMFILDDLVRLTSGQFQHYHPFGETQIYDDGGNISMEFAGSGFSPEVRGYDKFGNVTTDTNTTTENDERWIAKDPKAVMKRRFQMMLGGLGDMMQVYLRNPRGGETPELQDTEYTKGASFNAHLANTGAFTMQSAAGIGFELNSAIPVPKRKKQPWSPDGDKPENEELFKPKLPYKYDDKYPYARNLMGIDADAWYEGQRYQRFDELTKDFKTAEAADLQPLDDTVDHTDSTCNYSKYKGRKAGFRIEQDGSVRIWGAMGEEAYFRGGNIMLSCPGQIVMQAGKGIVGMADDVVLKAKSSVDITASDKDVRITAGENVMAYADKGGMLFEANGDGESSYNPEIKGEGQHARGIIFKAKNSSVVMYGKRVYNIGLIDVISKATNVLTTATRILSTCEQLTLETLGKAGILLHGGSATISGESVAAVGGKGGVLLTREMTIGVVQWASGKIDMYNSNVLPTLTRVDAAYRTSDELLGPYTDDKLENVKFTYRTAEQYGTLAGTEVYQPDSVFGLFQTRWQLLKTAGCKLIQGTLRGWKETAVNETYPWPGQGVRDQGYITASGLQNVDADGKLKPRASLQSEGMAFERRSMDEYQILV